MRSSPPASPGEEAGTTPRTTCTSRRAPLGPEPKRANGLIDPAQDKVRSVKAADVARPDFRLHPAALLTLQRAAGNRAVTALLTPVQRGDDKPAASPTPSTSDVGWSDAKNVEKGHKWNADVHDVGEIHRIPLEGLAAGYQGAASMEKLTKESAGGKAIALVPAAINQRLADPKTGPDV